MTAKEYLSQAFSLDQRINCKLEQVARLRELAEKATQTISDMPGSATRNTHRMEETIVKMIDLENEINDDIDKLIDIKREITHMINGLSNPEEQTLLELRYLCFKTWEQISVDTGYTLQNLYKLHAKALKNLPYAPKV